MCERDLRDLGITVADLHRELARPFWRDAMHGRLTPFGGQSRGNLHRKNPSCLS
jgi:hypothetical protein